ncbi:MAG: nuclear transport factor 2 family protein [Hyphomicrobiaceae bacterium]
MAEDWIDAWNAHDLDRILSHYADDIVFLSPVAERLVGNGRVEGVPALRSYWRRGLDAFPDLTFSLVDVLVGHTCLTILYRNQRGQLVAETLEIGGGGKFVRASACYAN